MKEQEFLDAVSHIEADVVESFVAMDARLQKRAGRSKAKVMWIRIGAVAASGLILVLAFLTSIGDASIIATAVMNYGPAISLPILLAIVLSFGFSFTKKEKTPSSLLLTNGILLAAINALNILGVCLYSIYAGINMIGKLPIILVSSNVGLCLSLGIGMAIIRTKKEWWQRLMLYLLLLMISVIASCLAHNTMAMLMNGDAFTAL